ncbi:MAG: tRNA 2-thiouridine(34) synthase MnmA [Fusobacterium sp.]|nr:tRNA 2-thiouridine(34) synthase MnmA [Fusobacterium sp.]
MLDKSDKRVVIGMSGGVDSSTAAYLLKKEGCEVIGVTLNISNEDNNKDIEDARKICKILEIKHIVLNIREDFEENIVKYFVDTYDNAETPSPCVVCDDEIKFKKLFEIADEYSAKYVATGHYVSVEYNEEFSKYLLKSVHSIIKDQTYMLYRLDSSKLERLIFPLEKYSKKEIREIAEKANLIVHDKKDSQGLCFAKEGYKEFLKNRLGNKIKKGKFVDKDGNILGEHEGYQLYTLGQRRGLGINLSKPVFITEIKKDTNEIVLGEYKELFRSIVELKNYKFNVEIYKLLDLELLARPRFSSHGFLGKLLKKNGKIYFKYNDSNSHNAEGQHLVLFYKGFVLGGGAIANIYKEEII